MGAVRSDAELLGDYAGRRDETAFAELAARHGGMVYRVCLRILGNAHEAEDASQATFVVLARKAGSLTRPARRSPWGEGGKADLAAWLHWTARNAAHWALRARARRRRHEEEAAMVRAVESASAGADRGTGRTRSSLGERLDDGLARLPEAERQAVVLRYLEGRSQEEAAAVAGCPVGTLSRRASDGLARLRERLADRDSTLSAATLLAFLAGEVQATMPSSLLPSLAAASKLTAASAAAGASGQVAAIAEGVVKAMFWAKMKVAAAVFAAVAAVGAGTPAVLNAVAGDGLTSTA